MSNVHSDPLLDSVNELLQAADELTERQEAEFAALHAELERIEGGAPESETDEQLLAEADALEEEGFDLLRDLDALERDLAHEDEQESQSSLSSQ